jgi:hypothetical protein
MNNKETHSQVIQILDIAEVGFQITDSYTRNPPESMYMYECGEYQQRYKKYKMSNIKIKMIMYVMMNFFDVFNNKIGKVEEMISDLENRTIKITYTNTLRH